MCDAQNASNGRFCGVTSARTKGFAVIGGGGGGGEAFIDRRLCGSWEWRNHYWFVVPLLEFSDLGFCDVS